MAVLAERTVVRLGEVAYYVASTPEVSPPIAEPHDVSITQLGSTCSSRQPLLDNNDSRARRDRFAGRQSGHSPPDTP